MHRRFQLCVAMVAGLLWAAGSQPVSALEPRAPSLGAVGGGRVFVAWTDSVPVGLAPFFSVGSPEAGFAAAQMLAPVGSRGQPVGVFTAPGHGGFALFTEWRDVASGDPKDPSYPIAAGLWLAPVAADGALLTPVRLTFDATHELAAVADIRPTGEAVIAWWRGQRSWLVRRRVGGVLSAPRRLGPRGFAVTDIKLLRDGSVAATGWDGGRVVAIVDARVQQVAADSGTSPPVIAANSEAGAIVAWIAPHDVVKARRFTVSGRPYRPVVIGHSTILDGLEVAIDERGRSLVTWSTSILRPVTYLRAAALDRLGKIRRVVTLSRERSGYFTGVRILASRAGRVVVVWSPVGPDDRAGLAFGDTTARFQPSRRLGRSTSPDTDPDVVRDADGSILVAWVETRGLNDGRVWLQRWRQGAADPPVIVVGHPTS